MTERDSRSAVVGESAQEVQITLLDHGSDFFVVTDRAGELPVDGRPVHGDTGRPQVARVFSDLRRHPGTMRLRVQESLSSRARLHSMRQVL